MFITPSGLGVAHSVHLNARALSCVDAYAVAGESPAADELVLAAGEAPTPAKNPEVVVLLLEKAAMEAQARANDPDFASCVKKQDGDDESVIRLRHDEWRGVAVVRFVSPALL